MFYSRSWTTFMFYQRSWMISYLCILFIKNSCFINDFDDFFKIFRYFSRFFKIFQDFSRFFMFYSRSWIINIHKVFMFYQWFQDFSWFSCFFFLHFSFFHHFTRLHLKVCTFPTRTTSLLLIGPLTCASGQKTNTFLFWSQF